MLNMLFQKTNPNEGGATQFLTTSEIKITKMTNLETGEIIIF